MARVHVESWRTTYRGLMSDEVLDDTEFVPRRTRFWRTVLSDPRFASSTSAAAESNGEIIGIAMAGRSEEGNTAERQLYVLYVLDAFHGSGAGQELLDAVLPASEPAALWVADPNPRAQSFYRKNEFREDGVSKVEDGVREIRMVRD